MSNPFAQDAWDPFANPFGQLPLTYSSGKQATATPDDDPFGLLSAAAETGSSSSSSSKGYAATPSLAAPPSYDDMFTAAAPDAAPLLPSYNAVVHMPPPPAYEHLEQQQQLVLFLQGHPQHRVRLESLFLPEQRRQHHNQHVAQQRELSAQIRLPPLNPKTAAPLKTLAAGLGCLFAGPMGEGGQILQWSPNESGSTLPPGAQPCASEDHDSGACAELAPRPIEAVRARVSSMLLAPGPGLLWCGASDGSLAAHGGKKVKALALCPTGRLFTGTSTGAIRMWNYGSPAFADAAAPRLLRQLCKLDARSGVQLAPHGKVVGLAVAAGGRVLWSAGKNSISLWSTHSIQAPADINPRAGLDVALLASQFKRPSAEVLAADDEAVDADKDAAAMLINTGVKAMGKASKLLNKLGNKLQEKASKILDESRGSGADLQYEGSGSGLSTHSNGSSAAAGYPVPGAYGTGGLAAAAAAPRSADALSKGDVKRVVAAADGSVWVGYKRGVLEKYSEAGQLLWSSATAAPAGGVGVFRPADITALAAAGSSVWVGDSQGQLWVLDAGSAALQRSWQAHVFPVRSIAAGGHLVYSLGKSGSIRAWPALPAPAALTAAWQQDLARCMKEQQLPVLVGTWNVNEMKPSRAGLQMWLAERAQFAQLVMIGLQEVEMGTMSVGKDAITQYLAKPKAESTTAAAQAWVAMVGEVLCGVGYYFKKVAVRQMSGILVLVFARAELEPHIGEVATASVACGVMGYGGNKGAVAVTFSLFRRRIVIVSSHFAAHQDKVESRNADYAKIVRHLHFHNVPADNPQQQQQYEASDAVVLGSDPYTIPNSSSSSSSRRLGGGSPGVSPRKARGNAGSGGGADVAAGDDDEEWGAGMRDAELLVWVGDFNYRVDRPDGFQPDESDPERNPVNAQLYQYVHSKISNEKHLDLLSGDQCIREMAKGTIFHGLAEGPIRFLPTYKFEKGCESNEKQHFYDQGDKKRVPAWTDRVLFRGSGAQRSALECNAEEQRTGVRVCLPSPEAYNSLMKVNVSDHKPVYAVLAVRLPWYQQQQQRGCSLGRLWQAAAAAAAAGGSFSTTSSYADCARGGSLSLLVDQQQLMMQDSRAAYAPAALQLRNPSRTGSCIFAVQSAAPGGALPTWLEVVPAAGVIGPGCCLTIRVQGTKSAQWQPAGGLQCELVVLSCLEGSVDSGRWPVLLILWRTIEDHDTLFVLAEVAHFVGIGLLAFKMYSKRSAAGLSAQTQILTTLFLVIRLYCSFMMEYDIHTILDGMTLLATVGVLYALWFTPIKSTYQADLDNVKFYYVVIPCVVMAGIAHPFTSHWMVFRILWAVCVYLEAVSVLPQLRMMQNSKVVERFTAHYVFCLGLSRFFSCAHWILQLLEGNRYLLNALGSGLWPVMVLLSEIVQTFILADFCFYYVKSYAQGSGIVRLPAGIV
ncbi:hypothetical protein COO60DRAFT_1636898 [Scenedesmus sp. NREL 46B-D3]|nr:hypothetical protein COO60DRAFT_1636898 [Scenedesmus sp. NREL 46B-D3]